MKYQIETVNGGCCLGDINPVAIDQVIQRRAKQGWNFEQMETVVVRFCIFLSRDRTILVFSKDE